MSAVRISILAVVLLILISVQDAALRYIALDGVVPNLALLVVVAAAVVRGSDYGAGVGLIAGLLLDFIPPATGTAGRWALALVIVGFLAGKVSADALRSQRVRLLLVAGCSFVATSFYALSGVVLGDTSMQSARMPEIIALGVVVDVVAALLALPAALLLIRRLRPVQVFS